MNDYNIENASLENSSNSTIKISLNPVSLSESQILAAISELRKIIQNYEAALISITDSRNPMDTENTETNGNSSIIEKNQLLSTKTNKKRRRTDSYSKNSANKTNDDSIFTDDEVATPKTRSLPPIRILNKQIWPKIHTALENENTQIRSAKNTSDAVLIYPQDVDSFRIITFNLDKTNISYTTNQLHQDRDMAVVLRGVSEALTDNAILDELKSNFSAVKSIHRMI